MCPIEAEWGHSLLETWTPGLTAEHGFYRGWARSQSFGDLNAGSTVTAEHGSYRGWVKSHSAGDPNVYRESQDLDLTDNYFGHILEQIHSKYNELNVVTKAGSPKRNVKISRNSGKLFLIHKLSWSHHSAKLKFSKNLYLGLLTLNIIKGTWQWGRFPRFCINQFGIGPLHYISSPSNFDFELQRYS